MYTNIESASKLVDQYIKDKNSPDYRYFIYQASVVKTLNKEFSQASELYDLALNLDLTDTYDGYCMNNRTVMKEIIIREIDTKKDKKFFDENIKHLSKNISEVTFENFHSNLTEKEKILKSEWVFLIKEYKKALRKLVNEKSDKNETELENLILVNSFLDNEDSLCPTFKDKSEEKTDVIIKSLQSNSAIKTITNIAFLLSFIGKEYLKDSGFWLKCGLNSEQTGLISRHLIISAGIYSQLSQSLMAEGMYRQALEILKHDKTIENRYTLSLGLFLYGRLLLRQEKRKEEGERLIKDSEKILFFDWYEDLVKMNFYSFSFE